jgi:hypothetical protein
LFFITENYIKLEVNHIFYGGGVMDQLDQLVAEIRRAYEPWERHGIRPGLLAISKDKWDIISQNAKEIKKRYGHQVGDFSWDGIPVEYFGHPYTSFILK